MTVSIHLLRIVGQRRHATMRATTECLDEVDDGLGAATNQGLTNTRPDGLASGRDGKPMKASIPLAFKAAGLMVPEPSLMAPTPFKAFVGWRVGG